MKYAEIKRQTLELANMNTIAGETVPGTYNNQQDYLNTVSYTHLEWERHSRCLWNPGSEAS